MEVVVLVLDTASDIQNGMLVKVQNSRVTAYLGCAWVVYFIGGIIASMRMTPYKSLRGGNHV
jgi:hypothetical protein